MQIYNFVVSELERCRKECNFSDDELEYFNLRARNKSNQYIALQMNISLSKANVLSKRVREKILKVI